MPCTFLVSEVQQYAHTCREIRVDCKPHAVQVLLLVYGQLFEHLDLH